MLCHRDRALCTTYSAMPAVEGRRHFADVVVQLQLLQFIVRVLVRRRELEVRGVVDAIEALRSAHRLRVVHGIDEDKWLAGVLIKRRVRVHALVVSTLRLLTAHVGSQRSRQLLR